jgi:hypothetical protein
MNLKMIFNKVLILVTLLLASCGSSEIVPTKDICKIKKHWKDNVFQVLINGEPINQHWYIHSEALDITKRLAADNKCMK